MTDSDPDTPAGSRGPEAPTAPRAVFGRRAQPPVAPLPAASPPNPAEPVRHDPAPPSAAGVAPNASPSPVAATPPQPSAAATPDPSKLSDEAFLAAEAIRLGIRTEDEADSAELDNDAKLIAEARRMGLNVGSESGKGWSEPFDDEMERTALLLGIRSGESSGRPARRKGGAIKALPWIVMLFLGMAGLAGFTLFMDEIFRFFGR